MSERDAMYIVAIIVAVAMFIAGYSAGRASRD